MSHLFLVISALPYENTTIYSFQRFKDTLFCYFMLKHNSWLIYNRYVFFILHLNDSVWLNNHFLVYLVPPALI